MPDPSLALRHVLVVEDEFFLADDLRRALEDNGSIVLGPVATVAEALAIIEAEAIDVAVLDINLGGTMSYPVADALIAHNVPFLFATGYREEDIPEEYASIVRLDKPVEPESILRGVAKHLR